MIKNFTDIAFTPSVKEEQKTHGSRDQYSYMENKEANQLSEIEIKFITLQSMFYMATVGENGWPYVQHKGGPKGFLKVFNAKQIGYADYRGNMQYITAGNLKANNRATLILMDYTKKRRLKIWVETKVVEKDNPKFNSLLGNDQFDSEVERFIVMDIKGFDWNCPQHIEQRFTLQQYNELLLSGAVKIDNSLLEALLAVQSRDK